MSHATPPSQPHHAGSVANRVAVWLLSYLVLAVGVSVIASLVQVHWQWWATLLLDLLRLHEGRSSLTVSLSIHPIAIPPA